MDDEQSRPGGLAAIADLYLEVFKAAPDGIVIVDDRGRILHGNPQLQEMFGYEPEDLVGEEIEILIPARSRRRHASQRVAYGRTPRVRPMGLGLELRGLRRDGNEFPVEVSLSPMELDGRPVVIAVVRDVSEQTRLKHFSAATLRAAENERQRIAQELHDDTAQRLATVLLKLQVAGRAQGVERNDLFAEIRNEVADIAEGVRLIARGLRPPELERVGVSTAIRTWVENRLETEHLKGSVEGEDVDHLLSEDARLVLYRVIQEAVSNAVRHAEARKLTVRIEARDTVVVATVQDDGKGFDLRESRRVSEGLGLLGMKERASMVGALVSIATEPGSGTIVRLAIPSET